MTDAPPTSRDTSSPATTRDAGSASPTTRDGTRIPGQPAPATARDGATAPATFVRVNLPTALRDRYRPLRDLPTAGAEADLLIVEALDGSGIWIVKIYRSGIELDGTLLDTIRTAGVDHVVGTREHGTSDGTWYEVLEYVQDGSLGDLLLASAGPIAPEFVREVVVELHSALTQLHELGVVHRDLKPDNVLVRTRHPLDLVLADFGLATVVERSWRLASASRTLAYAAPEAAHGHVSPARDWWSLGMIVLESLTGEQPLAALDDAVISIHLATRSIAVDGVADEQWRLLCRGLLTRDPAKRWGADEVRRWLAGERPPVVQEADEVAAGPRPYVFEGKPYPTPRALAVAMAAAWKAAARQLVADGLAYKSLTGWLLQSTNSGDLAARIDELAGISSPDKRVVALVYALAPELPPVFRDVSLAGDGLRDLARAARADGASPEAAAVRDLHLQRILPLYPGLEETAAAWLALQTAARERLETAEKAGSGQALDDKTLSQLAAATLELTVDPAAVESLAQQHARLPAGARTRPWFRSLGDDTAGRLVGLLLADVADGQRLDGERAAEKQAEHERRLAEQERQEQRRQRAARVAAKLSRSTGSTKRLLPFTALLAVIALVLPGWAANGTAAISALDSVLGDLFSDAAVRHQLIVHSSMVTAYGVLLAAVTAGGLSLLIAARAAPGAGTLYAMRAVNLVGGAATPPLWPFAIGRALGTARAAGNGGRRDSRLRGWAVAGLLPLAALAITCLVMHGRPATTRPFGIERPLLNAAPDSIASWYYTHWPSSLTLTSIAARPTALVVTLIVLTATASFALSLRSYAVRPLVERRGLQLAVVISAAACLPLVPYLLAVALYGIFIAIGVGIVIMIIMGVASG